MSERKPVLRPDPYDEAWNEFCEALWESLGEELPGLCMAARHSARHYFAERLLEARGFDAEASLALYEKRGGYCDCEILLNVDQPTLEDELASPCRRRLRGPAGRSTTMTGHELAVETCEDCGRAQLHEGGLVFYEHEPGCPHGNLIRGIGELHRLHPHLIDLWLAIGDPPDDAAMRRYVGEVEAIVGEPPA